MITNIELNINAFLLTFDYLQLNFSTGDTVSFLDLKIKFEKIFGKLGFNLYIKPTNTFSYLNIASNQPKSIFNNIPYSCFLRVKRICSNYIEYLYHTRSLFFKFIQRRY